MTLTEQIELAKQDATKNAIVDLIADRQRRIINQLASLNGWQVTKDTLNAVQDTLAEIETLIPLRDELQEEDEDKKPKKNKSK